MYFINATTTVNDRFSGNDWFSGPNPPDDAILVTVSRMTVIADFANRNARRLLLCKRVIQLQSKCYSLFPFLGFESQGRF